MKFIDFDKINELIREKKDVRLIDIPNSFKESYDKFIFGQTLYIDVDGNSVTHYQDFISWTRNKRSEILQIARDYKLDNLIP